MATKLIGRDDATADGIIGANYIVGDRYQCSTSGSCTEVRVKVSTNVNVRVAVYADNAGTIDARIAKQDTGVACVSGWNTITLESPVALTATTYYWITYNADTNSTSGLAATGNGHLYKVQNYAGYAWEATISGYSTYNDFISLFAGWETTAPLAGGTFPGFRNLLGVGQ